MTEAFDCKPAGESSEPESGEPPCFVAPPSLFDGGRFPRQESGVAPVRGAPPGTLGSQPAVP